MKYLKYFENKEDLDPFGEEDWKEEEEDEENPYNFSTSKDIFNFFKNTKFKYSIIARNIGMRIQIDWITDWPVTYLLLTYDDYIHIIGHNYTDLDYKIFKFNGSISISDYRNDISIYDIEMNDERRLIRRISKRVNQPRGFFGGSGGIG